MTGTATSALRIAIFALHNTSEAVLEVDRKSILRNHENVHRQPQAVEADGLRYHTVCLGSIRTVASASKVSYH